MLWNNHKPYLSSAQFGSFFICHHSCDICCIQYEWNFFQPQKAIFLLVSKTKIQEAQQRQCSKHCVLDLKFWSVWQWYTFNDFYIIVFFCLNYCPLWSRWILIKWMFLKLKIIIMKQSNINPLIKLKWDMWKARIAHTNSGNQNKYRAALNVVDLLFSHWFAGRFEKIAATATIENHSISIYWRLTCITFQHMCACLHL